MTNKAKLLSLIGFAPSNADVVIGALQDVGLTDTDNYVPTDSNLLVMKKAKLQVLRTLYSTADVTTSNSGIVSNSIEYDRNALDKEIKRLEGELGIIVTPVSTVRAVRRW